jgi:hypothetical protein
MWIANYKPKVKETAAKTPVTKPKVSTCLWIYVLFVAILMILNILPGPDQFHISTWLCFGSTLRYFINWPSGHLALQRPHLGRIRGGGWSPMVAATEVRRKHLQQAFKHGSWCPELSRFVFALSFLLKFYEWIVSNYHLFQQHPWMWGVHSALAVTMSQAKGTAWVQLQWAGEWQ